MAKNDSISIGHYTLSAINNTDDKLWLSINDNDPERAGEGMEITTEKADEIFFDALDKFWKEHF